MEPADAIDELEVTTGATLADVREAYRRLLRDRHPDLVDPADDGVLARRGAATTSTARLNLAYEVVVALLGSTSDGRVPTINRPDDGASADGLGGPDGGEAPGGPPHPAAAPDANHPHPTATGGDDEDSLFIDAPPDLTWMLLHEAAAQVGYVSYIDRSLGLLEMVVRFEGGPTCSVLMTLQGRAHHTEVMCTMSSIEAAPTPPIASVIDALTAALTSLG